mmetsp:Transcript_25002/g.34799  ORF Transcript_25002/g.34799 Transcript_25002/m.34799 type:complete len:103 (+) Transcript_25002:69-377(+)
MNLSKIKSRIFAKVVIRLRGKRVCECEGVLYLHERLTINVCVKKNILLWKPSDLLMNLLWKRPEGAHKLMQERSNLVLSKRVSIFPFLADTFYLNLPIDPLL